MRKEYLLKQIEELEKRINAFQAMNAEQAYELGGMKYIAETVRKGFIEVLGENGYE